MRRLLIVFLIPLLCITDLLAQGKLVLVGGGSEQEGGWSDYAYGWAVQQAANKKVAVISYASETDFIPNYFLSLGAVEAVNIKIDSRALALQPQTYDMLMAYDVFFFKGGDQFVYYNLYKESAVTQAIEDKFLQGGVIAGTSAGMAILSEVIFSAEEDTVYPDDALGDVLHPSITLRDDFVDIFPGYIFDTHFTERGRIARLIAFLANWYLTHDAMLTGVGVDDKTALCIDGDGVGKVFGSGGVTFLRPDDFTVYQDTKLVTDSVAAIVLLHGHSIDLTTYEILSGPNQSSNVQETIRGDYELLLSGADGIHLNDRFMQFFIAETGHPEDTVVVVTGKGKGMDYQNRLRSDGVPVVVVEVNEENNSADAYPLRNQIRNARKILFVENTIGPLLSFLNNGPTGELIVAKARQSGMVNGFIGKDTQFAGSHYVTNNLGDPYNSYYGRLSFAEGLSLLSSAIIIANAFDVNTTDYYENNVSAVPFAMATYGLRLGVYLNRESFVSIKPVNGENRLYGFGKFPALVMKQNSGEVAFTSLPVNDSGAKRNYTAFNNMHYAQLFGTTFIPLGAAHPSEVEISPYEVPVSIARPQPQMEQRIFPNPVKRGSHIHIRGFESGRWILMNAHGQIVSADLLADNENEIDISDFTPGLYYIQIVNSRNSTVEKIIIE